MRHNPNTVIVKVDAGSIDRNNDLIRFPFNPKDHFPDWQEGTSTLAISQTDADGSPLDTETPAQFEPTTRELTWQTGSLGAGVGPHGTLSASSTCHPTTAILSSRNRHILLITVDNQLFTRYNFLGVWKPYFWPPQRELRHGYTRSGRRRSPTSYRTLSRLRWAWRGWLGEHLVRLG